MNNCIFCKIIAGEIPASKVYEDEKMLVFKDIEPKAKVHLLAIPKVHFAYLSELDNKKAEILGHIFTEIPRIAKENGCENGYRLIINQGEDGGQAVHHLHVHILGGEKLSGF